MGDLSIAIALSLIRFRSVTLCRSGLDERNVPIVTVLKRNEEKEDGKRIRNLVESGWALALFDVWSQQPWVSC